ncbi:hypothetical protein B0H14DRAFT_2872376, partial [Mycena olivaceomarginata]
MSPHLQSIIKYMTLSAQAAKDLANSAGIPLLATAATLIILDIQKLQSNKDQWTLMVEQIHEILCAIITVYSISATTGEVRPGLLYDATKFAETLQRILYGKLKKLFQHFNQASQLSACKKELEQTLELFHLQTGVSTTVGVMQIHKNAEQQHEKLMDCHNFWPSTATLSMLPAKPQIFHGRESELQHILDVLEQDSPRIAILGTGGMGKTNLAIAVLHHPVVAAKYTMLYFVACQSASSCAELVANIAAHIGLEKSPKPTKKIIQHFLYSPPIIWEPQQSRHQLEEFLALLADVHNLALIITMRGTERPDRVKWTKPFLAPLKPLSHLAALQTFIDIADDDHAESSIFKLLDLTGNLPLAVNLIAHVAAYEGCNRTLARWTTERTHVLSDGYDEKSSLDISIMLSFTGARMTPEAQHYWKSYPCCQTVLSDAELVESSLPINNIPGLKVLVPIREHILANHPPSAELKFAIYNYYHHLLGLWNEYYQSLASDDIVSQISQTSGNLNTVLSDRITTGSSDLANTLECVIWLNGFMRHVSHSCSPLMGQVATKVDNIKNSELYRIYLVEVFASCRYSPVDDAPNKIQEGNQYFEYADESEKALHYHNLAVSFNIASGKPTVEGQRALARMAHLMTEIGNHTGAQNQAQISYEYAQLLGDTLGQLMALTTEAWACACLGNLVHALELCNTARKVICEYEAGIHLMKTEFSRQLGISIGTERDTICYHLDIAKEQFSTLLEYPPGLIICDVMYANLQLREGKILLQTFCLERLSDSRNKMHNFGMTLDFAGLFLALSLTTKNKLATMKALCSFAWIFVAKGDEETALNIFEVALEALKLWRDARPLYERTCQHEALTAIDEKLAQHTEPCDNREKLLL